MKKDTRSDNRLRVSIFRSNKHTYAQIIDDEKGKTIVSFSDRKLKKNGLMGKTERAFAVGEELAKLAKKKKIGKVFIDRGSYKYHGRVSALADGLRKGGLEF